MANTPFPKMEITLQTLPPLTAPPTERAHAVLQKLLASEGRPDAQISVLFVSDAHIQELNRVWRGLNKPTDVLSWPQYEAEDLEDGTLDGDPNVLGDVVVSVDTAARQAQAREWELSEEVALLLVHGVLHLLGYDDETEAGAEAMRQREAALLGKPLDKVETVSV
jgi:probable rRNA maturation factor